MNLEQLRMRADLEEEPTRTTLIGLICYLEDMCPNCTCMGSSQLRWYQSSEGPTGKEGSQERPEERPSPRRLHAKGIWR